MSSTRFLLSIVSLFSLFFSVSCNDLFLGYPDISSKLIFSKVYQENPAIWLRSDTFTVRCSAGEVINAIKVTDLRHDKWGEAYVKAGGIGQSYVTIELDSPTIFRGYNFWVEVFALQTSYFANSHGK